VACGNWSSIDWMTPMEGEIAFSERSLDSKRSVSLLWKKQMSNLMALLIQTSSLRGGVNWYHWMT
jgi:hypothetical protein